MRLVTDLCPSYLSDCNFDWKRKKEGKLMRGASSEEDHKSWICHVTLRVGLMPLRDCLKGHFNI